MNLPSFLEVLLLSSAAAGSKCDGGWAGPFNGKRGFEPLSCTWLVPTYCKDNQPVSGWENSVQNSGAKGCPQCGCKEESDPCAKGLFTVTCGAKTGFKVDVNSACQTSKYAQMTGKLDKIFAGHEDLDADNKAVNPSDTCLFSTEGSIQYGFSSCGVSKHEEKDGYTVFTSYLNHRVDVGATTVSLMDQTEIQCRFSNVELESQNDLTANNEITGEATITGDDLKSKLGLSLQAGTETGGTFTAATKAVDVGTEITIKLIGDTGFSYALAGCKAAGSNTDSTVALYDGYCPNTNSNIINLDKKDSVKFSLNLFRIGTDTSLTFTCTVKVFPLNKLPGAATTCTGVAGRRRRDSDDNVEGEEEIDVVVQLTDSEIASVGGSAAGTCANVAIPTLFLAALF